MRKGARHPCARGRDRKVKLFICLRLFALGAPLAWKALLLNIQLSCSLTHFRLLFNAASSKQSSLTILSKIEPIQLSTPLVLLIFLFPSDMCLCIIICLFILSLSQEKNDILSSLQEGDFYTVFVCLSGPVKPISQVLILYPLAVLHWVKVLGCKQQKPSLTWVRSQFIRRQKNWRPGQAQQTYTEQGRPGIRNHSLSHYGTKWLGHCGKDTE